MSRTICDELYANAPEPLNSLEPQLSVVLTICYVSGPKRATLLKKLRCFQFLSYKPRLWSTAVKAVTTKIRSKTRQSNWLWLLGDAATSSSSQGSWYLDTTL